MTSAQRRECVCRKRFSSSPAEIKHIPHDFLLLLFHYAYVLWLSFIAILKCLYYCVSYITTNKDYFYDVNICRLSCFLGYWLGINRLIVERSAGRLSATTLSSVASASVLGLSWTNTCIKLMLSVVLTIKTCHAIH